MQTLALVLVVAALVLGIVAVVLARGRDFAGWGVIAIAAMLLLERL